jgi:hypothetical protein
MAPFPDPSRLLVFGERSYRREKRLGGSPFPAGPARAIILQDEEECVVDGGPHPGGGYDASWRLVIFFREGFTFLHEGAFGEGEIQFPV